MDRIEIPDKTYFKIGEVAKLLELEPYVLRYWETEFDSLAPEKTRSGQRAYQRKDIELLETIQHLLHVELFTIAGARRQLDLARKHGHSVRFDPERVADLENENDALDEAKAAVEAQLDELEAQRQEDRETARALQAERDELAEELRVMRQRSSRMEGQIELITSTAPDPDELDRLRTELAEARDRIGRLERERDDLRAGHDAVRTGQREHLAFLRTQLEGLATASA